MHSFDKYISVCVCLIMMVGKRQKRITPIGQIGVDVVHGSFLLPIPSKLWRA